MRPLQHSDLRAFFEAGHRPREEWGLGIEYEQFVTDLEGKAIEYSRTPISVSQLLHRLQEITGWQPKFEGAAILGLKAPDGRALTIEPAAQLEFGSTPCRSLRLAALEISEYMSWLAQLEQEFDIRFLALGSHPTASPKELERIPKERYDVLEPYLQNAGELGIWMMKTTCGVQVNYDHSDEQDAMRKLRTNFMLAPVLSAMFANSAVKAGAASGYASWRGHIWTKTDPTRCGFVESLIRPDATFDDYIEWALDLEMLFIERDGKQVDARGRTFRQHMEAGQATTEDWEAHLSTPFPEARFRPQLELRSTDSMCPRTTLALAALVQGVFYDEQALLAAEALCSDWNQAERWDTWCAAHRDGLSAELPSRHQQPGRRTLLDLARDLVDLCVLAPEDAVYLQPLIELLEGGKSYGEIALERFEGEWQGDPRRLIEFSRCAQVQVN